MRTPYVLLKLLARALSRSVEKLQDGSLVKLLPEIAKEVWPAWASGFPEGQLRIHLQSLARASNQDVARSAKRLASRASSGEEALARYLTMVPSTARQALRRPTDPSGTSVPAHFPLRQSTDLLPLLPIQVPDHDWSHGPLEPLASNRLGNLWLGRISFGGYPPPWVYRSPVDPQAVRAVLDQASLWKTLKDSPHSPHRTSLLKYRVDFDKPWMVTDYIPGGNLTSLIHQIHHWQPPEESPPPWVHERSHRLIMQAAETIGLGHRHIVPLVHGNLKPTNLLMRPVRNDFEVVIADMGWGLIAGPKALANRTRRQPLSALALRGGDSALYASPRLWTGYEPEPRDDVFALGVVWSQLLTGDLMTGQPTDWKRWAIHLSQRGVSSAVIDLLTKCLAEDADDRPPDAGELAEQLKSILGSSREVVSVAMPSRLLPPAHKKQKVTVCSQGQGQYRSINEAMAKSGPGTRIFVRPGTYRESITLVRDLEIIGEGPTGSVVIESEDGDCVYSFRDQCALRNLTLRCLAGKKNKKFYCIEVSSGRLVVEDCDLSSDSLACMAVHGNLAQPVVRRCTLHDSQMGGLYFFNFAGGVIEDCEIFGNRYPGVEITSMANPTLRRCKIHHQTEHNGVMVYNNGKGLFEDCDIYANKFADLRIHEGGNPILRRCRIHEGTSCGVMVVNKGLGLLEDCELFGHSNAEVEVNGVGTHPTLRRCKIIGTKMAGLFFYEGAEGLVEDCDVSASPTAVLEIKTRANPLLKRCKIHSGKSTGVLLWEDCRGRFEECQIFGHAGVGVSIKTGGDPVLSKCRIRDGLKGGLTVSEKGKGTLLDCDLPGNASVNLEVRQEGEPVLKRCRLRDGKQGGVLVCDEGRGRWEDCDISGNCHSGLEVKQGGNPLLHRCKIRDGRQGGVVVWEDGQGTLEECTISGNQLAAVEIRQGGNLILRKCRIVRGKQPGVWVHSRGLGTVEQCELSGEAGEAWRIEAGGQIHRHGNKE